MLIAVFTRVQTRESASKVSYVSEARALIPSDGLCLHDRSWPGVSSSSWRYLAVAHHSRRVWQGCVASLDPTRLTAGTSPSDGAGLLAGVVTHLLNGANPRTVVLTHFQWVHILKAADAKRDLCPAVHRPRPACTLLPHEEHSRRGVEPPNIPLQVGLRPADGFQLTDRLTPELTLTSNAAECALIHGISEEIVERAREVRLVRSQATSGYPSDNSRLIATFQITSLIDAQLTDADRDEMALHEELARQFLNWNLDDDEMDVLGELEVLLQGVIAAEEKDVPESVMPGESTAGVSALERAVVMEATIADSFDL